MSVGWSGAHQPGNSFRFSFHFALHSGPATWTTPKTMRSRQRATKQKQKENFSRIAFYFVILTCDALAGGGPETMEISPSVWLVVAVEPVDSRDSRGPKINDCGVIWCMDPRYCTRRKWAMSYRSYHCRRFDCGKLLLDRCTPAINKLLFLWMTRSLSSKGGREKNGVYVGELQLVHVVSLLSLSPSPTILTRK